MFSCRPEGWTSLHLAAQEGKLETVKLLIQHGAEIEARSNDRRTPMHLACLKGHADVVQYLIQQNASCNVTDASNWTPLIEAANGGFLPLVKIFINRQVDLNVQNEPRKESALYRACLGRYEDVALYLLEKGGDPMLTDTSQNTCLHIAAETGLTLVVQEMVNNHSADIYAKNKDGATPLTLSCQRGHQETVAFLLHKGAVLNNNAEEGQKALEIARKNHHNEIVCLLINSGCLDGWYTG